MAQSDEFTKVRANGVDNPEQIPYSEKMLAFFHRYAYSQAILPGISVSDDIRLKEIADLGVKLKAEVEHEIMTEFHAQACPLLEGRKQSEVDIEKIAAMLQEANTHILEETGRRIQQEMARLPRSVVQMVEGYISEKVVTGLGYTEFDFVAIAKAEPEMIFNNIQSACLEGLPEAPIYVEEMSTVRMSKEEGK